MTEQDRPAPAGLKMARNIVAVVGAMLLLFGLLMFEASIATLLLGAGMLCLVVAAGIALATTRWRSLPTGARIAIVVALAGLALVMIDLVA